MIDIHSHIIFGVDDGSSNMDQSLRMMAEAGKAGIKTIIATPHFHEKVFANTGVWENYSVLLSKASEFGIELALGYEVFAETEMNSVAALQRKITLANSQYFLFELPFNASIDCGLKLVQKIALLHLKPILAHPERNRGITRNFSSFIEFLRSSNCLVQVDAASICGIYGMYIKEVTRQMLELKVVDFVASNAHYCEDYSYIYKKAVRRLYQWCDEEYAGKLLKSNAGVILSRRRAGLYRAI